MVLNKDYGMWVMAFGCRVVGEGVWLDGFLGSGHLLGSVCVDGPVKVESLSGYWGMCVDGL